MQSLAPYEWRPSCICNPVVFEATESRTSVLDEAPEMMDQGREKNWRELCQAAAVEQDPNKLMTLVAELNRVLDELHRKPRSGAADKKDCGRVSLPSYAT